MARASRTLESSQIDPLGSEPLGKFYIHWSDYVSAFGGIVLMVGFGRYDNLLFLLVGLACFSTLFTEITGHIAAWLLALGAVAYIIAVPDFAESFAIGFRMPWLGYGMLGLGLAISVLVSAAKKSTPFGIIGCGYVISYGLLCISCIFFTTYLATLPALILSMTCCNLIISTISALIRSNFIVYS